MYTWIGSVMRLIGSLGMVQPVVSLPHGQISPLDRIGFHASEGFEPLSRMPSSMVFLFGNPLNHIEAETIRFVRSAPSPGTRLTDPVLQKCLLDVSINYERSEVAALNNTRGHTSWNVSTMRELPGLSP